jgi:hypothetical protein
MGLLPGNMGEERNATDIDLLLPGYTIKNRSLL